MAATGNLVTLMRTLGLGLVRLGGVTVDTQLGWSDPAQGLTRPPWATGVVGPDDLRAIAELARATGWRILLGLNFGHYDPAAAADEARVAQAVLGAGLAGVELGNEPDSYAPKGLRPRPWGLEQYLPQIDAYRQAVDAAAPGAPLYGPDTSSGAPRLRWVSAFADDARPAVLTAHYYPLAWCNGYRPKVRDLLSGAMHAAEARMLAHLLPVVARAQLPVRIDETNNISCGGLPGVSNTYASALWALDFVARAATAGVSGINFHGNLANAGGYAPIAADDQAALQAAHLGARPEYYALLVAHRLIGATPVATQLVSGDPHLTAYAFTRADNVVQVLVVDEDPAPSSPVTVSVGLPRRAVSARALVLRAPSLDATTGVTLAGSAVRADGTWIPAAVPMRTLPARRRLSLRLAPASAVLADVQTVGR